MRAPFRLALDVALPALCPACREPVGGGEGLCASCWSKLSLIAPPYCERLGIPFAYDPGPGILSMQAIADPPAYARARAAVRYDDVARALVHALKYGDRLDLAPIMGRWMARAGSILLDEADVLVPVPLHWRRTVGAPFQPIRNSGEKHLGGEQRADRSRCAQADQGDRAAGRAVEIRARRERAGRLPRTAGRQGRDRAAVVLS